MEGALGVVILALMIIPTKVVSTEMCTPEIPEARSLRKVNSTLNIRDSVTRTCHYSSFLHLCTIAGGLCLFYSVNMYIASSRSLLSLHTIVGFSKGTRSSKEA